MFLKGEILLNRYCYILNILKLFLTKKKLSPLYIEYQLFFFKFIKIFSQLYYKLQRLHFFFGKKLNT